MGHVQGNRESSRVLAQRSCKRQSNYFDAAVKSIAGTSNGVMPSEHERSAPTTCSVLQNPDRVTVPVEISLTVAKLGNPLFPNKCKFPEPEIISEVADVALPCDKVTQLSPVALICQVS